MLASTAACAAQRTTDAGAPAPLHHEYEQLLAKYVGPKGDVRYPLWRDNAQDVGRLDGYLERLKSQTPDRFAAPSDALGYWLNLYNALVIREVLRRWPLPSVRALPGKGEDAFFRELTFSIGGKRMSLDQVENEVIRGAFKDARIHFALNCGAQSCPVLKPEAFVGRNLAQQLDQASRDYVNDPRQVSVNHLDKTLVLSRLFDWYGEDFAAFARSKGQPPTVFAFLRLYAAPELSAALKRAEAGGYRTTYADYDWRVNAHRTTDADAGLRLGQPLPDATWTLLDGRAWKPSEERGRVLVLSFWATYCAPCRLSFPKLQQLAQRHRDRGLVVVGIAQQPASDAIGAFLRDTGATFRTAVDAQSAAAEPPWSVDALPTELLIDRRGNLRYRHQGLAPGELDRLAAEVETLLQEPR